jgi:hypothetical protein
VVAIFIFEVQDYGFKVLGSGVLGSGFKGSGFKVLGSGYKVLGSRVLGSRFSPTLVTEQPVKSKKRPLLGLFKKSE